MLIGAIYARAREKEQTLITSSRYCQSVACHFLYGVTGEMGYAKTEGYGLYLIGRLPIYLDWEKEGGHVNGLTVGYGREVGQSWRTDPLVHYVVDMD